MSSRRLHNAGVPTIDDQLTLLYVLWGMDTERDLGASSAEGVRTRHFRADVDLGRAVCAAPEDARSTVASLAPDGGKGADVSVDAWVDAYQLVRRLTFTVDLGKGRKAKYVVRLAGDNQAEQVNEPPAEQIVALEQVDSLQKAFPTEPATQPNC